MTNRPSSGIVWVLLFAFSFCGAATLSSAATRLWDGGGADNNWMNATNWVGDVAPLAGDELVFPPAPRLTSVNNFPSNTTFSSITIGAPYNFSGESIALDAGIIATNGNSTHFNNSLILNSNQTFSLSVGSGVSFFLAGPINNNGKDLTLSIGSGTLAQVTSVISGTGGIIKTNTGAALFYASNTFSGPVQINQGTISIYDGHALGDTNGNTTVASNAILAIANAVTVAEPVVLSGTLNSVGTGQVLTGPLTLATTNATILVSLSSSIAVNGIISGSSGFTKGNPGTLTLNANNTYSGSNIVTDGILEVNGSQPATLVAFTFGGLSGTGTVGTVTFKNAGAGSLSPGGTGPGILTCSNLVLNSGTVFAVKLNGATPGSGYDQLNVHGTVALSNATLSLALGFTPALGDTFKIINNDGADSIVGTFSGLPSGALFTNGATIFRIAYDGGDGNDVTLTTTSGALPSVITSITNLPNGFKQLTGKGLSNLTYTVQATTNLTPPITWTVLGVGTANSSGVYQFTDTNAPALPRRFYRAVSP